MPKVISLPGNSSMTPEQALISASEFEGVRDILIIGHDCDGELFIRSSDITRKDALWLSEQLRISALED